MPVARWWFWCSWPLGSMGVAARGTGRQHPAAQASAAPLPSPCTSPQLSASLLRPGWVFIMPILGGDEPATRSVLEPFGRPLLEYATPTGGEEVLVAENVYDDTSGLPLRVERYESVNDDPGSNWIYS